MLVGLERGLEAVLRAVGLVGDHHDVAALGQHGEAVLILPRHELLDGGKDDAARRPVGHPSLPTEPGKSMRVEHEYARGGAWAYSAALDVHRAKVFGRCEATTGIAPFERLVEQVMSQAPYNTAILSNGSSPVPISMP